jgi:surfeit locus 1 family protein
MLRTTLILGRVTFRINLIIAVCVLLLMSGLVRLGIWQMGRAQEKANLQLSYMAAAELPPTPIDSVPVAGIEFDRMQHQSRRISMTGHYLNDETVYLLYQSYMDQSGYEVITPFMVDDLDLVVMVSRGWQAIADPAVLQQVLPAVSGNITLEGQIYIPEEFQTSPTGPVTAAHWPLQVRYLNPAELAPLFEADMFPYPVRLMEKQPGVLTRHWPGIVVDGGQNFSYALQWFAMALAVAIVSLILSSNARKLGMVPKIFIE